MSENEILAKKTLKTSNGLLFSYQVGSGYFSLIVPAIALFFSMEPSAYKKIFTFYFICMTILQMLPGLAVNRYGFRRSMIAYAIFFLIGSVIGYFSHGGIWLLSLSRILQAIGLSVIPFFTKVMIEQLSKEHTKSSFLMRVVISAIATPFIVILAGLCLHFYTWQLVFIIIAIIYLMMLVWMILFMDDIDITNIYSTKKQLYDLFQYVKTTATQNKALILRLISLQLIMTISSFLSIIYAFVFHAQYHLPILFVSTIPMMYSLATLITPIIVKVQNYISVTNRVMIITSVVSLVVVSSLTCLTVAFNQQAWAYVLAGFILQMIFVSLIYLYMNTSLAHSVGSENSVTYNILYYLLKNMMPLVVTFIWSLFDDDRVATTLIIFGLSLVGTIIILKSLPSQLSKNKILSD